MKFLSCAFLLLFLNYPTHAVKLKLATLVPKGTSWAKTLKEMSDEIKKSTDGKVNFRFIMEESKEMNQMFSVRLE